MMHRKRSPVLIVAVILLSAACGGTASSVTNTPAATPTATAAALVKGEFVGVADRLPADRTADIAFSTNGSQVIAYLCDGTTRHISLAQWFSGPVTSNGIDITNAHGSHLVAAVTSQAITGTITLKDGTSVPFKAYLIPHPGSDNYGLFRSEETFQGGRYLGGWIMPPVPLVGAWRGTGTQATLASVTLPMITCCVPEERGGIIDEQTGALIVTPTFSGDSVTVPGVGTFRLTPCREAQC